MYLGATIFITLVVFYLVSSDFDPSKLKMRGKARAKRQQSGSEGTNQPLANAKDPFAGRPRISSRNGHLIIESSQDKNIEFRSGGARGSVLLNGQRMEQLFGVARAFASNSRRLGSLLGLQNETSSANGTQDSLEQQYDLLLASVLESGRKLGQLEAANGELRKEASVARRQLAELKTRVAKRGRKLKRLAEQQEAMNRTLRENNCVDARGQPVCLNGGVCVDLYASFKCLCPKEWEGERCELDVDECSTLANTDLGCQNGAQCENLPGSFRCKCAADFRGVLCTERHDDCALAPAGALCGHGRCVNVGRREPGRPNFQCICDQGWTVAQDGDSPACTVDVDECAAGRQLAADYGLAGPVYAGNATGSQTAAAISASPWPYPCSQAPFVECVNLPGSFRCAACPPGYTGNGHVCRDVDECADGQNGGCSRAPLVECINVPGGRRCGPCPPGFAGDGQLCRRLPPCQASPNGGCHPAARCLELAGASLDATGGGLERLCECHAPFEGHGVGPEGCVLRLDAVAGARARAPWLPAGELQPRPAAATPPPTGYAPDDCDPNPCLNGGACRRVDTVSFECACAAGWAGRLCELRADLDCGGQLGGGAGLFRFPPAAADPQAPAWFARLLAKLASFNPSLGSPTGSSATGQTEGGAAGDRSQSGRAGRLHACTWQLRAAPANLSLKLDFFNLAGSRGASTQLHLLNGTAGRAAPPCERAEHLDVLELGEPEEGVLPRRLARVCVTSGGPPSASGQPHPAGHTQSAGHEKTGRLSTVLVASGRAALEYSFALPAPKGRPSEEPQLSFQLDWQSVEPACGGELEAATSGSLSSPNFPRFYAAGVECRFVVRAPPGNRLRLQFGELSLLAPPQPWERAAGPQTVCADSLTILDGAAGSHRPLLFRHCANGAHGTSGSASALGSPASGQLASQRPGQLPAPVVSSSAAIELVLRSRPDSRPPLMRPGQRAGFLLTFAPEPQEPGCGGLFTARAATLASFDFEPAEAPQAPDEALLAAEYGRLLRASERQASGAEVASSGQTSSSQTQAQPQPQTRCEFEIRPGERARNHQIQLQWLQMPATAADYPPELLLQTRRARCHRAKLSLLERPDSQQPLATFCAGDQYDARPPGGLLAAPITAPGHALFLVYETAAASPQAASSASLPSSAARQPGGFKLHYTTVCSATYRQPEATIVSELDPAHQIDECLYHVELPENNTLSLLIEPLGFVLAANAQADAQADALANAEPERLLPLALPDGSCAVQAIVMDGPKPRGPLELAQLERQLRDFRLRDEQPAASGTSGTVQGTSGGAQPISSAWETAEDSLLGPQEASRAQTARDASESGNAKNNSAPEVAGHAARYWQYARSSQAHDIKEFDVCHWPAVTLDSMWNHLSLVFRLNSQLVDQLRRERLAGSASGTAFGAGVGTGSGAEAESVSGGGSAGAPLESEQLSRLAPAKIQVRVRYRAQRACGGILTSRQGSFQLVHRKSGASGSSSGAGEEANCAWILRNLIPNQPIRIEFQQVPTAEIERRRSAWIAWVRASAKSRPLSPSMNQTGSAAIGSQTGSAATGGQAERKAGSQTGSGASVQEPRGFLPAVSNCAQAFEEMVEFYEPSVNRTRLVCPSDLVEAARPAHWRSHSDTVYVRLLNSSAVLAALQPPAQSGNSSSSSLPLWPGRAPLLAGGRPLVLSFAMQEAGPAERGCGGKLLQSAGLVQSPRHPFNYPAGADCVWLIQAQGSQQQIRLNFTRFELEPQLNCIFDFLEIRNGPSEQSPLVGRFCNRELQGRVLVSHSASVYLRFRSDAHINRAGFRLEFEATQSGCGGLVRAPSGHLQSPNFPLAFAQAADCEWLVELAQGSRLALQLDTLDLGGSSLDSQSLAGQSPLNGQMQTGSACDPDAPDAEYLEVLDGPPEGQGRSLSGRLCRLEESKAPLRMRSSGNTVRIVYRSQAQDAGRGFSLSFRTECALADQPIESSAGALESPGFPEKYPAHLECAWRLRAPLGSSLHFRLVELELEDERREASLAELPSDVALGDHSPKAGPLVRDFLAMMFAPPPELGLDAGGDEQPAGRGNATGALCPYDWLRVWALRPADAQPSSNNSLAQLTSNNSLAQLSTNNSLPLAAMQGARLAEGARLNASSGTATLERQFCGSLAALPAARAAFTLDTNEALVQFRSDRATEMRGFRLEWRAQSACGGHQLGGQALQTIAFDERSLAHLKGPVECVWTVDLAQLGRSIELELSSDLRPASAIGSASGESDDELDARAEGAACAEASLSVYDGRLASPGGLLARNCRARRPHQTLVASSGLVLVRLFLRRSQPAGRSFLLQGWPSARDGCSQSFYDVEAPFLQTAVSRASPNYPDRYEPKPFRCSSLFASSHAGTSGRLRFTVDELDMPASSGLSSSSGEASSSGNTELGLKRGERCKEAESYLLVQSVGGRELEHFCGAKFERSAALAAATSASAASELAQRSQVVLEQSSGWLTFSSRGLARGKWRVSVDRLCGSALGPLSTEQEFATPNFPGRPRWPPGGRLGALSEQVCVWRLSAPLQGRAAGDKLRLQMVQFEAGGAPDDCLRVYEGLELSLRQSAFNLSELDARHQPKLRLCKQADLTHSSLSYTSQGNHLLVLVSGATVAKFRVGPLATQCGGELAFEGAQFGSPNFPQPYPPELDCHYFLFGAPSSKFALQFDTFELAEPEQTSTGELSCDNVDHLELRQLSLASRIQLRLGSLASGWPKQPLTSLRATLAARNLLPASEMPAGKNQTVAGQQQSVADKQQVSERKQQLDPNRKEQQMPPELKRSLESRRRFLERLFELSKLYRLTSEASRPGSLELTHAPSSLVRSPMPRLAISLEDYYARSRLVGRFCGRKAPKLDGLLQDELLLRFRSFAAPNSSSGSSGNPRGFLASYKLDYGGLVQVEPPEEAPADNSAAGEQPQAALRSGCGLLGSPRFPAAFQANRSVAWTLETRPGHLLELELVSMQLGGGANANGGDLRHCANLDALSLFDGPTEGHPRLARLCGHLSFRRLLERSMLASWARAFNGSLAPRTLPLHSAGVLLRRFRSSSPVARLLYENFRAPGLFLLRYCAVRETPFSVSGLNASTNNGNNSSTSAGELEYELERPLDALEQARHEQYSAPMSDSNLEPQAAGSASCSRSVLLTPSWLAAGSGNGSATDELVLESPGWPREPNEDELECHWHVFTRDNTNVRLALEPGSSSMVRPGDLPPGGDPLAELDAWAAGGAWTGSGASASGRQADCVRPGGERNMVLVYDGSSVLAPLLARYCLPAPPVELRSSGRHLFVRYVHSAPPATVAGLATRAHSYRQTNSLFRARARLAQCGGQHYVTGPLYLRDRPLHPRPSATYQNNLDCSFQLFARSLDQVLVVHFPMSDINLSATPTNADCSVGDFLEIRDLPLMAAANPLQQQQSQSQSQAQTGGWRATSGGRLLAKLCAGRTPDREPSLRLESPGPALELRFVTDGANVAAGWTLFVSSSEPHYSCPRASMLLHPNERFGYLSSPNWPQGFTGQRRCKYNLVAPLGRALELTFVKLRRPTRRGAPNSAASQCLDSIQYLADNEALALRYNSEPLAELRSVVSKHLMRQLVRELNCSSSLRHYAMVNSYDQSLDNYRSVLGLLAANSSDQQPLLQNPHSYGRLSLEQFEKLKTLAPSRPLRITTNSRVLLMEYLGQNLAQMEGFLAIYRVVEPEEKCGFELVANGPNGANLIQSAKFGQKMDDSDDFVQCEWSFKLDRGLYAAEFDALVSDDWWLQAPISSQNKSTLSVPVQPELPERNFSTSFMVFQTIELPPQAQNASVFVENWSFYAKSNSQLGNSAPSELCGPNRMLLTDFYNGRATIACGFIQTKSFKWTFFDDPSAHLILRTKNLQRVVYDNYDLANGRSLTSADQTAASGTQVGPSQNNVGQPRVFRGLKGYFYASECPSIRRLPSGSLGIKSHLAYRLDNGTNVSQYRPSICRWIVRMRPGEYEVNLLSVSLRNATVSGQTQTECDPDSDPKLDYIEFSSDELSGSPILARICVHNQASLLAGSHQLKVRTSGELQVLFVAGLERLAAGQQEFDKYELDQQKSLGFEMKISRLDGSKSDNFCLQRPREPSVYNFIRNKDSPQTDYAQTQLSTNFLYPKNVHCQVDLIADDEQQRFNFSFVNYFDLEQSHNCTADYVEVSDLVELSLSEWLLKYLNATTTPAPGKRATTPARQGKSRTTSDKKGKKVTSTTAKPPIAIEKNNSAQLFARQTESLVPRRIGRWCGRQLPKGFFVSKSNSIRVEFHTNDHVQGKGFMLEYSLFNDKLDDAVENDTTPVGLQ